MLRITLVANLDASVDGQAVADELAVVLARLGSLSVERLDVVDDRGLAAGSPAYGEHAQSEVSRAFRGVE